MDCGLVYAQEKLEVEGNLEINSTAADNRSGFVFTPQAAAPAAPAEGQIYYDDALNRPSYYDGSAWQTFGTAGQDKTIASKIVAASNSLDTTRADYVGDGTDDQVEIQQAIDDLGTTAGAVYLLEGTYNISASINLNNTAPDDSGKAIIGTGAGTALKVSSGANNVNVINASSVNGILISQLRIDGNKINVAGTSYGIYFSAVTGSKVNKVWIENMRLGGIYLDTSSNNTVFNNYVKAVNWEPGIKLLSANNNVIANNIVLNGQREGIFLNTSSNNIVSSNIMEGNQWSNLCLTTSALNNVISNNIIVAKNIGGGIGIQDNSSNNVICGNNVQGSYSVGIACQSSANRNIIYSNNVQDSANHGIVIQVSNENVVGGNIIHNSGGIGNFSGIWLTDSDNSIFSSNRISDGDGTGYGINIFAGTCDNNYLVGNLIDGAGYANRLINDAGTSTRYTQKEKITIERQAKVVPAAGSTLDASTNPKSYVPLAPAAAVTLNATTAIADGKAIGDMLILEGASDANTVTIPNNANVKLSGAPGGSAENYGGTQAVLGLEDTLKLLWNGTDWLEIGYSNN
ncbi:MAG: right-handed parallel beta-helix repeat-containing protein [Candidatus Omnitrophica bacterium]|nr:right-handed parallel beta-helix repeat-containing protein [Candidatus Omnitrophota bacterium]